MFGHNDESQQNDTAHQDAGLTPVTDPGASDSAQTWQHPGSPLGSDDDTAATPAAPAPETPSAPAAPTISHHADAEAEEDTLPANHAGTDDLINIKQQALTQLSPLVGHLEQTPEEKFRTTMMMIQASDDQSLIKTAYDAAQKIEDEKTRAQALLDIVNEINYFTQHTQN